MKQLNLKICFGAFVLILISCKKENPTKEPLFHRLAVTEILTNFWKGMSGENNSSVETITTKDIVELDAEQWLNNLKY